MRSVMVVDDERWIRRGLIQSIPWERLGLELAGEAGDGEDAYQMALELAPDLLFLDMRMPGLDGKELLGMLSRALPRLLTIVVSGYSDFEYTKEAIRHNAFDYLLKPVKKDELAGVLEKALAQLEQLDRQEQMQRRATDGQLETWLSQALFHEDATAAQEQAREEETDEGIPACWREGEFAVWVGKPDRYADDNTDPQRLLACMEEKLAQSRAFFFGGQWAFALTRSAGGSGELVATIAAGRLSQPELSVLLADVQSRLKQACGISVSFGVSGKADRPQQLRQAYLQARKALADKRLGDCGVVLPARETAAAGAFVYPHHLEQSFLLALQIGNGEAARQEFEKLFAALSGPEMTVGQLQRGASILIHSIEKQLQTAEKSLAELCGSFSLALSELFLNRNDAASVKAVFTREIIPAVLHYYEQQGDNQGEKIVREVERLIQTHYDQTLSLQQIAESRYLNPDYLSRLFKKTTGSNFVDYLTDTRIRKSIELLQIPGYKNYEIAQLVGYEDYRYFSQIFKKKTGKTIGDYRHSGSH